MRTRTLTFATGVALVIATIFAAGPAAAQEKAVFNQFWCPDLLDLKPLRQNAIESNSFGEKFDYAADFNSLDLKGVKKDIAAVLSTSQPCGPSATGITARSLSAWNSTARAPAVPKYAVISPAVVALAYSLDMAQPPVGSLLT